MKVIIVILIALLGFAAAKKADPVSEAALFVDGFLRGALSAEIGRVDECLTDGDTIVADVDKLIKDAQSGFDLLKIITDVGSLLVHVPNSIRDCHELPDTVQSTFKNWVNKIKNPIQIAKIVYSALAVYRNQLQGDVSNFLALWQSGQFEASGQSLGDIPHILFDLCTPPKEIPVAGVALFLDGFLRSALDRDIGRVDDCLQDADILVTDIENVVNHLKQKFDLLPLIGDIGKLLTDVPNSIRDCHDFKDTVKDTFSVWLKEIKNPITIAKIAYMALSTYRSRLQDDASEFVTEWKTEHFEDSGKKLGDIPHVLFDLCAAEQTSTRVQTLLEKN